MSTMFKIFTDPIQQYGHITGRTTDPDHEWLIQLGVGTHCNLYIDGEFVHHGTMETCTRILLSLTE